MIGKSVGNYRILDRLGVGGMGEVYLAEDARLGRQVAVKMLPATFAADPERLARFEREARAVAALNHPGIVTVYSVEQVEDLHLITMEYVDGESMDQVIEPGGLPRERFFELAGAIVDAVCAAHDRGIVHRDLKPANIMVTGDGRVKVLDFGLAKAAQEAEAPEDDGPTQMLTREGTVMGTAAYMSPEQARGDAVDHLSDIFSLGVILYQMATGQLPFRGQSPAEVISAILRDAPRPLHELNVEMPGELGKLVERCLAKQPSQRVQTAARLRDELERVASQLAEGKPQRSMAVLPFVDMSPERDQDYFCEGLAEELISGLARLPDLKVASRTSAFQFKGSAADIREIGRQLGVSSVLEGSVRKAGNRIRISAQLVNVADGYQLWSDRYDRELQDVFAIQDEISANIVEALELTLSPQAKQKVGKKPSTTDIEAYDYFLRGRKFFHRFNRRDQEFALQMFGRAIEIDPEYARAHAGVADCSSVLWMYFDRDDEHLRKADEASLRGLELGPDLADTHASRGLALSLNHRFEEAQQEFERAIALDPELFEAYYFYARAALAEGRHRQAAELFERACEVRPEDYQAPTLLATVYEGLGRHDKAAEWDRAAFEIIEKHRSLNPDDARALYFGAGALIRTGQRERGIAWAKEALALGPDDPIVLYNVACVYAKAFEIDAAMDALEQAVKVGYAHVEWIQNDHDLDPLRDQPRFQRLLERLEQSQAS